MESIARDIRRGIAWVVLPLSVVTLLRLALEPAYWNVRYVAWMLMIPAFAVAHLLILRRLSPLRTRISLLLNFAAISIGYTSIGAALRSNNGWRADAFIYSVDKWVFHGDPQRFLTHIQTPWLSTVTIIGYMGFAGYLIYLFLSEAFTLTPATGRLQLGLMRLYGLGFSGYLLLPAAGPAFNHPELLPPIHHSAISAGLQPLVLAHCSHVDVAPSIHAAVCAFLLVWTWRRHRRLFWFLVPPSAALLLGTVYLQYHYFIDLPFGLLLGTWAALSVSHAKPASVLPSPGAAG